MYESPIKIIESAMDSISKSLIKEKEDAIILEVKRKLGVDVDRSELLHALQYDRFQYDKGYDDGYEAGRPKWISVKNRLPEIDCNVLVIDRVTGEVTTAHLNDFNSFVFKDGRGHGASYWMPLPTPPKEDE